MANNVSRTRVPKNKINDSKIFVIDLDGTICDVDSVFFKIAYALSFFGLEINSSILDNREFITLADCGILTEEDESRILTLFEVLKIWENLDPFPGVLEFLQKISNSGCSIVYLTARSNSLRDQTTNWLKKNGFPRPPDVEFGNESLNSKVTLIMKGINSKKNNLKIISDSGRPIVYFENDPFYIKQAIDMNIKNIYSFKESYILGKVPKDKVYFLDKPKNNAYSELPDSIFK